MSRRDAPRFSRNYLDDAVDCPDVLTEDLYNSADEGENLLPQDDTEHGEDLSFVRLKRVVAIGFVLVCGLALTVTKKAWSNCQNLQTDPALNGDEATVVSLSSLVQPLELVDLRALSAADDDSSEEVRNWLAEHLESEDDKEDSGSSLGSILDEKDPKKASELMDRTSKLAIKRWQKKRNSLKTYLSEKQRKLRGPPKWPHRPRTPSQKASVAECVFNVEQALTQIVALAANIDDSTKTCPGDPSPDSPQGKLCAANIGQVLFAVSTIAGSLSVAADNCAETMMPNTQALCAGAVTGIVGQVSQLAATSAVVAASCGPEEQSFGALYTAAQQNEADYGRPGFEAGADYSYMSLEHRRLDDQAETGEKAVPPRELLFGGGPDGDVAQCYIDVTSIMWWLAQAGLAINAAANPKASASCHLAPKHGPKKVRSYSEALCTVDVAGALFAFGEALMFIQYAVGHCGGRLDVQAMCGAGITGLVSSFAGFASSASAIYLACHELHHGLLNKFTAAAASDSFTNALGQEGNFGRRLSEENEDKFPYLPQGEAGVKRLQERFKSPRDAWQSIGFNLTEVAIDKEPRTAPTDARRKLKDILSESTSSSSSKFTSLSEPSTGGGGGGLFGVEGLLCSV